MERLGHSLARWQTAADATSEPPNTTSSPSPDCVICGDTGLTWGKVNDGVDQVPCGCRAGDRYRAGGVAAIRRDRQVRRLCSDPRWRGFGGACIDAVPAGLRARLLAALDAGSGVYLWGGPGVGKTYAAMACVWHLIDAGRSVYPIRVPQWLAEVRRAIDAERRAREAGAEELVLGPDDLIDQLARADVVLLDDLGAEQVTPWAEECVYRVVDERLARREAGDGLTIVTSNASIGDLAAQYSRRIASRLRGLCQPIEVTGPDRRIGR
jgi:hypothetical protein